MKGNAGGVAGLGSGALVGWLWNAYMVPMGHPEMPEAISIIVAGVFMRVGDKLGDLVNAYLERKSNA